MHVGMINSFVRMNSTCQLRNLVLDKATGQAEESGHGGAFAAGRTLGVELMTLLAAAAIASGVHQ